MFMVGNFSSIWSILPKNNDIYVVAHLYNATEGKFAFTAQISHAEKFAITVR